MARSCRLLDHFSHEHFCFGHVSARLDPGGPVLVKAAGVGLGRVTAADVARVSTDGVNLTPDLRLHDETVLHLAVYRHRPDVGAVVHTHPAAVQAATALRLTADVFSQDGVCFHRSLAWYDSAALVSDERAGEDFAACLGSNRGVLLRSHGLVTVGADIVEACALALLLNRAVSTWLLAASAGTPRPIADDDLESLAASFSRSHRGRMQSIWFDALRDAGLG